MFNTPGFVGCRIVSDGSIGTIRFIGMLPNSEGIWYGVEWDDPERGKHNGTYNGVRYFTTSSPKSGSFIRLRKIDFGVSLWSAIETRYGEKLSDEVEASGVALRKVKVSNYDENANTANTTEKKGEKRNENYDVYVASNDKLNGTRKKVEVVGLAKLERQRTFQRLTQVSVRGAKANLLPIAMTPSESSACILAERGNQTIPHESDLEHFERFATLNLQKLRVLDLSNNLFHSWAQIMRISRVLPSLSELILSENRLQFLQVSDAPPGIASLHRTPSCSLNKSVSNRSDSLMRDFDESDGSPSFVEVCNAFSHVDSLHLKATDACWRDVLRVASYFSNLKELHACGNRIVAADFDLHRAALPLTLNDAEEDRASISSESGLESQNSVEDDVAVDLNAVFSKLDFLCLEDNPINHSAVFDTLCTINSLRTLVLRRVGLRTVRINDCNAFPSLVSLNLAGNQLSDWHDVDELNKINALRDVRVNDNPLMPSSNSGTNAQDLERQFAVARLPRITRLNGVEINSEDRKAAERDYVRSFAEAFAAAKEPQANETFVKQHPRFAELLSAFPDLEGRFGRSATCEPVQSQLVSLTFRLDIAAVPKGALEQVSRKLPRSMTVDKVKALAQRLLKLGTGSVRLSYVLNSGSDDRVYLDNELRTLAYYDVTQNGTVIFVSF